MAYPETTSDDLLRADTLLNERQTTHGDFSQNAIYGQELRSLFRSSPLWVNMPPMQREALDNIATKFSRILSGQADFAGHWEDVEGYARLARQACMR